MQFSEYQKAAAKTDQLSLAGTSNSIDTVLVPMLGLASEVGSLLGEYKKVMLNEDDRDYYTAFVREELGDVLWYVSSIADKFKLNLDDIAFDNIVKCDNRWPSKDDARIIAGKYVLDGGMPSGQRLPRRAVIRFIESGTGDNVRVKTSILTGANGEVSEPNFLTDNAYDDDGYRYHDVFHLAYGAILGWTPVFRKFLVGEKRPAKIDEIEDGGRAKVIEEGVSALVFSDAKDHGYYEGATSVPSEILRIIKNMTAHLEVRVRSHKEWQRAILEGYRIFRLIRERRGGDILIDLDSGAIEIL